MQDVMYDPENCFDQYIESRWRAATVGVFTCAHFAHNPGPQDKNT